MPVSEETWALCVEILTAKGMKESTARALIGRQNKLYDEADIVKAYEKAAGKADPRAYAAGILAKCKTKQRKVQEQMPLAPPGDVATRDRARAAIRSGMAILKGREPGSDDE